MARDTNSNEVRPVARLLNGGCVSRSAGGGVPRRVGRCLGRDCAPHQKISEYLVCKRRILVDI